MRAKNAQTEVRATRAKTFRPRDEQRAPHGFGYANHKRGAPANVPLLFRFQLSTVNSRLLAALQSLFSGRNSGYSQARTLAATAWAESYMEIATRQSGVATIVDVTGDITLYNSPQVRKILLELLREKRVPRVVVNLLKVKYIDSAGVASLVEGLKISRELKNGFALYGLSPIAREVFELTRLIKVFEVYDNEEDAVRGPTGKSPSGAAI